MVTVQGIAARVARWEQEGPQGPMVLEVYPTLACNLDCSFCDTTDRHRPPVDELPTKRWLEIIDEAAQMGVQRVFVLGGGEPLARPDAPILLRHIKDRGLEGVLTTNGTLLRPPLITQLIETGWDEIHLSIDGPTPEIHDALRGQAGAFKRTVRAACQIAVLKRRHKLQTPRIALHFVLTRMNWQTLPDMVRLASSLGAFRVDFDALIAYRPEQKALQLDEDQRQAVAAVAAEALALADSLGIATTLENFLHPERLARGASPPPAAAGEGLHGAPCLKAWHYLVVQADGRSSPCCVLAGEGGSARSQPLEQLWQTDPFLEKVRAGMLAKAPLERCRECSWNILSHEAEIRRHLPGGD
jgi:MoaA/NifB/PqqE/SkfB family radical SAM enzyme